MAEPPLKRPKPSTSGLSAFAALASKKTAQSGREKKPYKATSAKIPKGTQTETSWTSSIGDTSAIDGSQNQARMPESECTQVQYSAEASPEASASRLIDRDILRLRALLFPNPLDPIGEQDTKTRPIETIPDTRSRDIDWQMKWRHGQEQAIGEISALRAKCSCIESCTSLDVCGGSKMRLQPFVRATLDLVCATLSDQDPENENEWRAFFSSLHTGPSTHKDKTAERGAVGKLDAALLDSTRNSDGPYPAITASSRCEDAKAVFSSKSFALRATYAMTWIRFVNAFADRDVRTSRLARQITVTPAMNADEQHLPMSEPQQEEEYVTASQPQPPTQNGSEAGQKAVSESLPSFLSLNPYEVLSLQKSEEDFTSLSAPDPPGVSTDPNKGKKTRNEGTMYAQASLIDMPLDFVDLRHQCVHDDDIPPLEGELGLRKMVKRGLSWVWERYWKHYDGQPS